MVKSLLTRIGLSLLILFIPVIRSLNTQAATVINNSSLIPKYVPDSQVKLEDGIPDWVKTLIMAEVRIETATPEGTFDAAIKVLDHYAEMGVNGLWITPPYADDATYGVKYPDRLSSKLTGTTNVEEGFKVAKRFVDEAHKRNIRIYFDIVTWGTTKDSPWVTTHPHWYDNWREAYGGYVWKWSNKEWQEWFINNAVNIVLKTGIDGFRCDLEPDNTGHDLFGEVRRRLLEKGRKISIFSEIVNYRYWENGIAYDFEQVGVGSDETCKYHYNNYDNYFLERGNIVDCIKTGKGIGHKNLQPTGEGGTFRYYTFCLANHDHAKTVVNGNRITIGYQAIFAPFIPLWYIGEEWNNPKNVTSGTGVLFFNRINWSLLDKPENRAFFEDVKKMIRIRRTYPEIFNYYPDNHQETNICKVKVIGTESLEAYARFYGNKGILVVPNANIHNATREFKITIPFKEMGLDGYTNFTVTELMTDKTVVSGNKSKVETFSYSIPQNHLGVFLVTASGGNPATTTKSPANTNNTTRNVSNQGTTTPQNGNVTSGTAGENTSGNDTDSAITDSNSDTDNTDIETTTSYKETGKSNPGGDKKGSPIWIIVAIITPVLIAAVVVLVLYKKGILKFGKQ